MKSLFGTFDKANAGKQSIDEALKAREQMAWGERVPVALMLRTNRDGRRDGVMNNIQSAAEEIVLNELIYC